MKTWRMVERKIIQVGGNLVIFVRKIFRKINISYILIHARTCAYQGVRNVSLSENVAYVLNDTKFLLLLLYICLYNDRIS